jgi:secreted trypsin-like serine protease
LGGANVHIRQIPYQVSLRYQSNNKLIGGGAIISERHILTAAHCLYNKQISDIRVYSGSNTIAGNRLGISIQYAHIHPGYTGKIRSDETYINDIAVASVSDFIME